jgi:hypothetical protein
MSDFFKAITGYSKVRSSEKQAPTNTWESTLGKKAPSPRSLRREVDPNAAAAAGQARAKLGTSVSGISLREALARKPQEPRKEKG